MVGLARWARFVLGPVIVRARGELLTSLAERGAQDGDREPGRDGRVSLFTRYRPRRSGCLPPTGGGKLGGQAMAGSQPGSVEVSHPYSTVVVHPHQDLQREVERDQRGR